MTDPVEEARKSLNTMKLRHFSRFLQTYPALAIALVFGLSSYSNGFANDVPADNQALGDHVQFFATDGGIRDDETVRHLCEQIIKNGGKVKDVKMIIQSCYGGGILDDLQKAFGPGGICEGIPWVGVAASGHYEPAWGWSDSEVEAYPNEKIGSGLSDALFGFSHHNVNGQAGVGRNGQSSNNVMIDFRTAAQNDAHGPNGSRQETPVVASGNGGYTINWRAPIGQSWDTVGLVWGGRPTHKRHGNNVENARDGIRSNIKSGASNILAIESGTRQDWFDAIETVAAKLDENTQLVIYIDDHGGPAHDVIETRGDIISITGTISLYADLEKGWYAGMWGNWLTLDPLNVPYTWLDMNITNCDGCSGWEYLWNGYPLHFPPGDPTGPQSMEVPWHRIYRKNVLKIIPPDSNQIQSNRNRTKADPGGLELSKLELVTGGINELEADQRLIPAQSAAFYDPGRTGEGVFVELLDNGKAVVYVFTFTPDGTGQSWMLGVGEQVGIGIVITEMFIPTGPTFGPDFDSDDLVMNPLGGLALAFPSCGTNAFPGVLAISPGEVEGYNERLLSEEYVQLTEIVDCQNSDKSPESGYSGSWFDPSHNGEGIILEVLKNGTVVVQWFTFDKNGGQMWIQGTGTIVDNVLTVTNLYTTSGTAYGSGFNPENVIQTPWGTLTMEFVSCSQVTLKYNSTAGFGSGTLNMTKLTNLMGIPCEELANASFER